MALLRRSNPLAFWGERIEQWLESERAQGPLWAPVALGAGICAWFALPTPMGWVAWVLGCLGLGLGFGALARGGRLAHLLAIGAVLAGAGCLLVWGKALLVGAPPLARPVVVMLDAQVRSVDPQAARDLVRLDLAPIARPDLPKRVRVNAEPAQVPAGLAAGDHIAVRARLMPPAPAALPGGYDFARSAYFDGIGATGRALGAVKRTALAESSLGLSTLRQRLGAHVAGRLPGPEGGIAVAFATGDQGRIGAADAEAMRRSGLAHLLSISGVHVSALIGGVVFLVYRLLALSPALALRWPILLIAACAGAVAGVGYTLLTGAQVPTVRSCIAALLVMGGLALGREAISLRLVATGALLVMLFWPEAVIGPSFQMSFAAVTSIIALYEWPRARALFERREERRARGMLRGLAALLVTGLAVEIVLAPIAFAHFHRAGLLGAAANLVAIPLTSFVVMPAEVAALLLDIVGLGAPAWWIASKALALLLALAHGIGALPYATTAAPATSGAVFVVTMVALLWTMLWHGRIRWLGLPVAALGLILTLRAPAPDLLVTADGRHVALRTPDGGMALLRERAGDYVRSTLAEAAAYSGDFTALADMEAARCSRDLCEVALSGVGGAPVRLLVTRSNLLVPYRAFIASCAQADLVIADRALPKDCRPRWVKLDRPTLAAMGGARVMIAQRRIIGGHDPRDHHPWIVRASPRQWPEAAAHGR
ncbi:MAG TPA: ComEC/Rec2 family competence protein [Sphingobium sp.]|nr:ComEC/Rec2 family competence protein [Sphingobium sp.]